LLLRGYYSFQFFHFFSFLVLDLMQSIKTFGDLAEPFFISKKNYNEKNYFHFTSSFFHRN